MSDCIYQFKFSEVQPEFVHIKLLSLPLKTNLDVLYTPIQASAFGCRCGGT